MGFLPCLTSLRNRAYERLGTIEFGGSCSPTVREITLNDGYLGLVIDEGRSKVRQVS